MPKIQYPRYIILGLLSIEPMSGYDIKKWVDMSFHYFWDISYGQIYPTLRDLEKAGLVTMIVNLKEGTPAKKIYTITEEGLLLLKTWLEKPEEKEFEILIKLFFGDKLPKEILIKKVKDFRELRKQDFSALEKTAQRLEDLPDSFTSKPYLQIVCLSGVANFRAQIAWADETLERLKIIENTNQN
jgi:DNA-binding PadR family transcriptional regulator